MNVIGKFKITVVTIALALVCGTAKAQHWRSHHRAHRVVTVVTQPVITVPVSNGFSQKERLGMAVAYLETHKYLTIKKYAKMTKLTKATAEAELDAFAMDKHKPVKILILGKKKVYIKK